MGAVLAYFTVWEVEHHHDDECPAVYLHPLPLGWDLRDVWCSKNTLLGRLETRRRYDEHDAHAHLLHIPAAIVTSADDAAFARIEAVPDLDDRELHAEGVLDLLLDPDVFVEQRSVVLSCDQERVRRREDAEDAYLKLSGYDWILINSSAGKDSQAMLDLLVELADKQGVPREKLVVVHADLGRVEWAGTRELAEKQAAHYGIRFEVVARPQGDLLERRAVVIPTTPQPTWLFQL